MWGIIEAIGSFLSMVWSAISAAVLAALELAVAWLTTAVVTLGSWVVHGLWTVGRLAGEGLIHVATFVRDVAKPLLAKAWAVFLRVQDWVKRVFAPVVSLLHTIRDDILGFYKRFVRPVLDLIDVARQFLGVLQAAGVTWAQKLDAELSALEQKIYLPFKWALERLSQCENWINRIVTADGVFQRVTLLHSLAVHARASLTTLIGPEATTQTRAQLDEKARQAYAARDPATDRDALVDYLTTGGGVRAGIINELAVTWLAAAGLGPNSPGES